MNRLKFKQKLSGCANAELLKRLKTLHVELAEMDQETIQLDSLNDLAKELMSPALLMHKEKGVRAYVGCALVDMLRLFAPEAPYTEAELKDIFEFLFAQLKFLTTAKEPHYSEYFYLLESFANVKSIVIICDLAAADELMTTFFRQSFDTISSESPKNVEIHLADILCQLIEESANLPSDVIDILLVQFLQKNVKAKPAALELAVIVCQGASDKLQRHVTAYFADVVDSSRTLEEDSDASEEDKRPSKAHSSKKNLTAPTAFVTAHALIRQLNRRVPSLLLNIIPLLESELTAPGDEYRLLATKTLGSMLGEKVGHGDVAKQYQKTWTAWLGRHSDKCYEVRVALTESLGKIWKEHAQDLGGAIEKVMIAKLLTDPDDKVRVAACNIFLKMDYETACHGTSLAVLLNLGERTMDKKANVRGVAFEALGRFYSLAFPQIESRDKACIEHFAWIPTSIFKSNTSMDTSAHSSIRLAVEHCLYSQILPVPSFKDDEDLSAWVDRLLIVYQNLDEPGRKAFLSYTRLADRRPGGFAAFIDACEKNNGGTIDEDEKEVKDALKQSIHMVAASFPEQNKAADDLNKFAKANEKQLYKLIRVLMDPASDLKTIVKTQKEALRRVELIATTIVDTLKTIIHRCSYLMINKSSIPLLLKKIQHGSSSNSSEARAQLASSIDLLTYVSKSRPALYLNHTAELLRALGEGNDARLITVSLHALSRLIKSDRTALPDKKLAERAKYFALEGTPVQAKYAATIIALDTSRPGAADDIASSIADSLVEDTSSELVTHLSTLTRLARFAPNSIETRSEEITAFLIKDVLVKPDDPNETIEEDVEWLEDSEIDDLSKARVLALKTLVNRCIAHAGGDKDSAKTVSAPVFLVLFTLLKKEEEDARYSAPVASRLRLTSALSILKLATVSQLYLREVCTKFALLAFTAQDPCWEIRHQFIQRLCIYLRTGRINAPRFNMILFLVAHDPELDLIAEARSHVRSRIRLAPASKRVNFEQPFVRLIHLLAHHPDFTHEDEVEEIQSMAKYIDLYLDCVANAENVPYLFHLALRLKTIRDLESDDFSNNLYILSELSQHLIKKKAASNNWPIPTFPGHAQVPADIFGALPSTAVAKAISEHSYLAASILDSVAPLGKTAKSVKAKTIRARKVVSTPKAKVGKRKSDESGKTSAKRVKQSPTWKSSENEEEESDSASDSEDSLDEQGETTTSKKKAATKKAAPVVPSKRAGLRRGGVTSSPSKVMGKGKKIKKASTVVVASDDSGNESMEEDE